MLNRTEQIKKKLNKYNFTSQPDVDTRETSNQETDVTKIQRKKEFLEAFKKINKEKEKSTVEEKSIEEIILKYFPEMEVDIIDITDDIIIETLYNILLTKLEAQEAHIMERLEVAEAAISPEKQLSKNDKILTLKSAIKDYEFEIEYKEYQKEKHRESSRRYYQNHREEKCEKGRQYYKINKEYINARHKKYNQKNREHIRAHGKRYREEHKEEFKMKRKKYCEIKLFRQELEEELLNKNERLDEKLDSLLDKLFPEKINKQKQAFQYIRPVTRSREDLYTTQINNQQYSFSQQRKIEEIDMDMLGNIIAAGDNARQDLRIATPMQMRNDINSEFLLFGNPQEIDKAEEMVEEIDMDMLGNIIAAGDNARQDLRIATPMQMRNDINSEFLLFGNPQEIDKAEEIVEEIVEEIDMDMLGNIITAGDTARGQVLYSNSSNFLLFNARQEDQSILSGHTPKYSNEKIVQSHSKK